MKSVQYGHQGDDKPVKHPKQAQSNPNKVVNDQLSPMRKNQEGLDYLEALLRRLNKNLMLKIQEKHNLMKLVFILEKVRWNLILSN